MKRWIIKPFIHAKTAARKFGGIPEDYLGISNFIDSTKAHVASMIHRAILHNSFGIYLCEKLFGYPYNKIDKFIYKYNLPLEAADDIKELIDYSRSDQSPNIVNSEGDSVSVRDVAEQHVLDDLGTIPSLSECLEGLPLSDLLGARKRKILSIKMVD